MKNSEQPPMILIVEDIDWIRSGMSKAVEREGYRVAEVRSAAEALKFAEHQSIDLILTEEELPTFIDLTARLSTHPILSSVRLVIINPDSEGGERYGDAYILADYADISSFLAIQPC